MTPRPVLSICVCTYNRAEDLRALLASIEAQQKNFTCELIVIDNNSTDETPSVVASFSGRIRHVFEGRQGLSHARNRALQEFSGDYLLFIDDDVRLAPNFLANYHRAIESFPDYDYFGGRIVPDWPDEPPRWARGRPLSLIDGLLVWLDHGDVVRAFEEGEAGPFGASFALSRRLIDRVGSFSTQLGCVGATRGRGEETEWVKRARAMGARGVYVGDALCHHRVDPARLRLRALFDYGVASGASHQIICGERRGSRSRLCAFALRGLAQLLRGRGDRFRQCVINMGIEFDALRH
ncbi:MAG: glycosyltransferase family 2 protein [Methylocystis sp.]|nr:glycosyltransferase family 2 protein [Methylocystis sp.]